MKKKRKLNENLFIVICIFLLVGIIFGLFGFKPILLIAQEGFINIFILSGPRVIIDSPENITYNFTITDYQANTIFLDLNVTSTNTLDADIWRYELEGIEANSVANAGFLPNISFNAFRKSNRITVFGMNSSVGIERNESVSFFVFVPNSAPIINGINSPIYACENSFVATTFNATDIDWDDLSPSLNPQFPQNPFFIRFFVRLNRTLSEFEIFSGILNKNNAGGVNNGSFTYNTLVSVSDNNNATCCSDSLPIDITVIEVNNAPIMGIIPNQAILTSEDLLYNETRVNDTEDGNETSGRFNFNISFVNNTGGNVTNLFNITNFGVINFTSNNTPIGDYNVTVCVSDRGLLNPHVNISNFCGVDGGNLSICQTFNLIVSEIPTPPAPPSGGGGGGGGGGGSICTPKWGCEEWTDCRLFEKLLNVRVIRNETLREEIMEWCNNLGFSEEFCGHQSRTCSDLNNCNIQRGFPNITRGCYYTEDPSCSDSIKNCHSGSCEVLVDCGGPCDACPSCRDGIQNQGEAGIDCGGPCLSCIVEGPSRFSRFFAVGLWSLGSIFFIIIIALIIRTLLTRKQVESIEKEKIQKKQMYSK